MSRRPAGQSEPNLQRQDFRTVAEHWIGKLKEFRVPNATPSKSAWSWGWQSASCLPQCRPDSLSRSPRHSYSIMLSEVIWMKDVRSDANQHQQEQQQQQHNSSNNSSSNNNNSNNSRNPWGIAGVLSPTIIGSILLSFASCSAFGKDMSNIPSSFLRKDKLCWSQQTGKGIASLKKKTFLDSAVE